MVVYQRSGDHSPIEPPTMAELEKHRWNATRRGTVSFAGAPTGDKSQAVRLADVFFIGPVMVVGGARLGGVLGNVLAVLGIATVLYNAQNYNERARIDSEK